MNYQELVHNMPALFDNTDAPLKIITDHEVIRAWEARKRAELAALGKPKEWAEIGVVLSDPYIVVLRDLVQFPNGRLDGYFRIVNFADIQGGRGVAILPRYREQIVLLHQYRHATRSWSLEIPRGFGEKGISPEENAHREVEEEIGGAISELTELGDYHNNTGAEANNVLLYFAELSSLGSPKLDEGIDRLWMADVGEFSEAIRSAAITDGFTIAAFTRAHLRGII